MVQTDHLIQMVLKKPELVCQKIAWSVEMSELGIKYESRGPMKAQCLADLMAKLATTIEAKSFRWKLYVDGLSNTKGSGIRVILESPEGVILEQSLQFEFETTNNQAEFEAFLVMQKK